MNFFLIITNNITSRNIDLSFWITLYIIILYIMDVNLNVTENNMLHFSFLQASVISITLIRFISSFERKTLHFMACHFQ
jgi:hypothetical protein